MRDDLLEEEAFEPGPDYLFDSEPEEDNTVDYDFGEDPEECRMRGKPVQWWLAGDECFSCCKE